MLQWSLYDVMPFSNWSNKLSLKSFKGYFMMSYCSVTGRQDCQWSPSKVIIWCHALQQLISKVYGRQASNEIVAMNVIARSLTVFFCMKVSKNWIPWPTSGPKFCVVWLRKMPAAGWGSLRESSSFVPRFSTFVFRNVPGTVPECVRICGFRRNSSNLDRAPKIRDSVLLNSWDSFFVTLPSISSETCVINSSLVLGTDVFRDWPFLGCSWYVSLVTAASSDVHFRLFLNVAIFLKGKCYAFMKTELVFIC